MPACGQRRARGCVAAAGELRAAKWESGQHTLAASTRWLAAPPSGSGSLRLPPACAMAATGRRPEPWVAQDCGRPLPFLACRERTGLNVGLQGGRAWVRPRAQLEGAPFQRAAQAHAASRRLPAHFGRLCCSHLMESGAQQKCSLAGGDWTASTRGHAGAAGELGLELARIPAVAAKEHRAPTPQGCLANTHAHTPPQQGTPPSLPLLTAPWPSTAHAVAAGAAAAAAVLVRLERPNNCMQWILQRAQNVWALPSAFLAAFPVPALLLAAASSAPGGCRHRCCPAPGLPERGHHGRRPPDAGAAPRDRPCHRPERLPAAARARRRAGARSRRPSRPRRRRRRRWRRCRCRCPSLRTGCRGRAGSPRPAWCRRRC